MTLAAKSAVGPAETAGIPSERRNPTASSSSSPGVRMVTAMGRPATRISSGSSTAISSGSVSPSGSLTTSTEDAEYGGTSFTMIATIDVLRLTEVLPQLPKERTRLLDNLGRVRREVGPITPELSDALADHMNIRRGEVHEVVSFYSFLQVPMDVARVCTGPVCDCMGARADGALPVACVGHCDLAPVRMQGDEIVGGVTYRTNS